MDAACPQGIAVLLNVGYRSRPFSSSDMLSVSSGITEMQATYTPENFKAEFKPHFQKLIIVWGILIGAVLLLYVYLWQFTPFFTNRDWFKSDFRFIAVGGNMLGLIAIGLFHGFGIVAICPCTAVGVFAIGMNAVGIVAVGGSAFGVIAIGGHSMGVVAIGGRGIGVYSLFYHGPSTRYQGKYMLSPNRQDAKAVAIFTRFHPKRIAAVILLVGFLAVSSGAAAAVLPCSHCGKVVFTYGKQQLLGKHLIFCPRADR